MAARLVGMIGLGVMGSAMAANLLKAGFKVVGYDPLPACRARHRRAGGTVCESALDGVGKLGSGSRMKVAANLLVAIHNVSAAEAVVLARRSGLNAALAVQVLGGGAGGSRMLQVRGPMMAKRRYTPATMSNKLWQ